MDVKKFIWIILGLVTCDYKQQSNQPKLVPVQHGTPPPVATLDTSAQLPVTATASTPDVHEEKSPPLIPSGQKVLIVGDSLAVGLSGELSRLLKTAKYLPVSHAKIGSTTAQWINWIKTDLAVHKPALVIVSLGTNDAAADPQWLEKNKDNFAKFTKIVMDSGAKLLWIGPPEFEEEMLPRVPYVRDLIIEAAPIFYDSRLSNIPRAEDKIHSTVNGYKSWAGDIWSWLLKSNIVDVK